MILFSSFRTCNHIFKNKKLQKAIEPNKYYNKMNDYFCIINQLQHELISQVIKKKKTRVKFCSWFRLNLILRKKKWLDFKKMLK